MENWVNPTKWLLAYYLPYLTTLISHSLEAEKLYQVQLVKVTSAVPEMGTCDFLGWVRSNCS